MLSEKKFRQLNFLCYQEYSSIKTVINYKCTFCTISLLYNVVDHSLYAYSQVMDHA